MAYRHMETGPAGLIRFLLFLTAAVLAVTLSLLSYSNTGYTFTKYPGVAGEAVVCVEGEVGPTNQTVTIINDGESPTVNPHVMINDDKVMFNATVFDKGVRQRTDLLRLGCNRIGYGAESDTKFKVKFEYLSHWRPVVRSLEVKNLMVGHYSRYFIFTDDPDRRPIAFSRLNITDISRNVNNPALYDSEFNGSAVSFILEQPGNYRADLQVYDGYVWSDIYEAGFTAHVIATDEQKPAHRTYELEDDKPVGYDGIAPLAINPNDKEPLISSKRAVDGAYIAVKTAWDYLRCQLPK